MGCKENTGSCWAAISERPTKDHYFFLAERHQLPNEGLAPWLRIGNNLCYWDHKSNVINNLEKSGTFFPDAKYFCPH